MLVAPSEPGRNSPEYLAVSAQAVHHRGVLAEDEDAVPGVAAKEREDLIRLGGGVEGDLARLLVAAEREIRTTVCLRPFRAPGFRLAIEKLDEKLCIHNYGHGGAGITLSWGTAQLATEEVRNSGQKQIALLGCGVVGLAAARLFATDRQGSNDLR